MLMVGVLLLVLCFQTSDNLAAAYGMAVTGTMLVPPPGLRRGAARCGNGRRCGTAALIGPFLLMDLTFLAANALKILSGGWAPLLIGVALSTVMPPGCAAQLMLTRQDPPDSDAAEGSSPAAHSRPAPGGRHGGVPDLRPTSRRWR